VSASPRALAGGVQLYLAPMTPAASRTKDMAPACHQKLGADREANLTIGALLTVSVLHGVLSMAWKGQTPKGWRAVTSKMGGSMMRCGKHGLEYGCGYQFCGTSAWVVLDSININFHHDPNNSPFSRVLNANRDLCRW
jgi:hypothetical protein